MSTNNDAWKLSNPDDDGHYSEDTKPRIEQSIYFKFRAQHSRRWFYGMITTSGHEVRVWDFGGIRTIDVDEMEPYAEEAQDEIDRIKLNYTDSRTSPCRSSMQSSSRPIRKS
jgi:hypothetical protein